VRSLDAAEITALVTSLGSLPERWSNTSVEACTDGTGACLHRGVSFADDWVREVCIVAPPGQWIAAARRYCRHLFRSGARQLRWNVSAPVDPRHEALWARYGGRAIAFAGGVLTIALDDPSLRVASVTPWPRTMYLALGVSVGPARFSEMPVIAAWGQEPRNYEPLGFSRGATLDELIRSVLPENPLFHAKPRAHLYTLRRRGVPVGVIFERQRDYEGDTIREIDSVINDETLPVRSWAEALSAIADACFARGATRMIVNVREGFPGMAEIFGADPATPWIAKAETRRTHYTATPAQFYASIAARRFLRHRIESGGPGSALL